jgi:hypothetical protein
MSRPGLVSERLPAARYLGLLGFEGLVNDDADTAALARGTMLNFPGEQGAAPSLLAGKVFHCLP